MMTVRSCMVSGFPPDASYLAIDPVDQLNDAAGKEEDRGADQPAQDGQPQGTGQAQEFVAEDDHRRTQNRSHEGADTAQLHHGDGQQEGLDGQGGGRYVAQVVDVEAAGQAGHEGDHGKDLDFLPVLADAQGGGKLAAVPQGHEGQARGRVDDPPDGAVD